MKKIALFALLVAALSLAPRPFALAAPAATHRAYRLSFQGNMCAIFPEPGGRWLDELLEAVDLRAECISWTGGAVTRLDFLIGNASAASLAVLELEGETYLCGSLFPEVPLVFYEGQMQAVDALREALFPRCGVREGTASIPVTAEALSGFARAFAEALERAGADGPEQTSARAFAQALGDMAARLARCDPETLALTMRRTDENDGVPAMEDAQCAADVAVERLLRALIAAIGRGSLR